MVFCRPAPALLPVPSHGLIKIALLAILIEADLTRLSIWIALKSKTATFSKAPPAPFNNQHSRFSVPVTIFVNDPMPVGLEHENRGEVQAREANVEPPDYFQKFFHQVIPSNDQAEANLKMPRAASKPESANHPCCGLSPNFAWIRGANRINTLSMNDSDETRPESDEQHSHEPKTAVAMSWFEKVMREEAMKRAAEIREELRLEVEERFAEARRTQQITKFMIGMDLVKADTSPGKALIPHLMELLDEALTLINPFQSEPHLPLEDLAAAQAARILKPNPLMGELLGTMYRVAEIGTATEFVESRRHPGYLTALKLAAQSSAALFPLKVKVELAPMPHDRRQTTPEQRQAGVPLTEYDKYLRESIPVMVGMNFTIPPGAKCSLPDYGEPDHAAFTEVVRTRSGKTIEELKARQVKAGRIDSLAAEILRDWLPRCLWRCSTREGLRRLGKRCTAGFEKAYDEAVRRKGLSPSRCRD